jgi:hypothetical protein
MTWLFLETERELIVDKDKNRNNKKPRISKNRIGRNARIRGSGSSSRSSRV